MTLALEIRREKKLAWEAGRIEGIMEGRREGETEGEARGRIKNAQDMLRAGLVTLAAIKASGLYSEQEIEAIMTP